jgi:hypothetical protein
VSFFFVDLLNQTISWQPLQKHFIKIRKNVFFCQTTKTMTICITIMNEVENGKTLLILFQRELLFHFKNFGMNVL